MNKINKKTKKEETGIIITYVLVFGSIFLIIFGGLVDLLLTQWRNSSQRLAWNQSLHVAEAGINYYKWCINNNIEDNCSIQKDYLDSEGKKIGEFSLDVTPSVTCGEAIQKEIISTGKIEKYDNMERKISVIYARPSVAKYSYILNDNVWIGADHTIRGPYHSNGGIRIDGENQSTVTSAAENWVCTDSFGCSPCPTSAGCKMQQTNCVCPGVFTTANGNESLFQYPIPPFDFGSITIDLAKMKIAAKNSGIYLFPSSSINSQAKGYHIILNNNGTFTARIITGLTSTYAYSLEEGWHYDNFTISSEYFYNDYSIPSSCSAIFVEDNLWIEGTVKGKVAIASANLIDSNTDTDIVLPNSINYETLDGSDGLSLTAEKNILIGPQSPNQMILRGIFTAQKGRFGRNHYPNNIKQQLEIVGAVVSNGRVGTQWTSGSQIISGYRERESYFDSNLIYNAPPFVSYLSPEFQMVRWQEVE